MRHKRIVTEISNSKHRINHTKGIPRLNFSHRSELTETKLNKQQILKFKIKVCIRIRPINKKENSQQCIRVNSDTMINLQQTQKKQKNYTFVFDKIITQKQSNEQIHDNLCKQLVNSSLKGYNSSIFAYGPTGSGKTFTMFGNSSQPGLIHLSLSYLFSQIQKNIQTHDFIVKMVCVQIYNQNLYDLLSTTSNQVQLRQCPIRGIFLSGATQKMISSQYQAHEILKKVINHRQTNSNNLNEFSSRSHAILQIYLQQKQIGQGLQQQIISSKISLIDLAGSQKMNITNNLYQCKKINQSLLVLGNCIHQLSKNCQKGSKNHIPYRNSKLTRLLKDSLGGNTRTIMISTISPSISSFDETFNTLMYSSHAIKIELKIKKNIKHLSKNHLINFEQIIEELRDQNEKIKRKIGIQYDRKSYQTYKSMLQKGFKKQIWIRKKLLQLETRIQSIQFTQYKTYYQNSRAQKMFPKNKLSEQNSKEYQILLNQKKNLSQQYSQIKQERNSILKQLQGNSIQSNQQLFELVNNNKIEIQIKQLNYERKSKHRKNLVLEKQKVEMSLLIEQLKARQSIIHKHDNVLRQNSLQEYKSKQKNEEWQSFYRQFLETLEISTKAPTKLLPIIKNIQTETSNHAETQPNHMDISTQIKKKFKNQNHELDHKNSHRIRSQRKNIYYRYQKANKKKLYQ